MSDDSDKSKPAVCENFEPQAWRKTICKNCFQPPDKHVPGASVGPPGVTGKENKPPAVPEKPKPGFKTDSAEKSVGAKGEREKEKTGTSLANSIKDKYEQLEKDKHTSKEPPKVAPKSTQVKSGLSSITDKYEKLKGDSKSTDNIPPSIQSSKKDTGATGQDTKTFPKKDDRPPFTKPLNKPKFGSVEDITKVKDKEKVETKLGQKSKFGSVDKLSKAEEKEKVEVKLSPKAKFGSTENVSKDSEKDKSNNKYGQKSKFGSIENVSKNEEKEKIGFKIGQKSKFGSMENVSSAEKSKEPIHIPIQRNKFGGSADTLSSDKNKSHIGSDSTKRTLLNKLDDFSNELKAGATSTVGSTVIHKQTDGNIDVIPIPNRPNSSKVSRTIDSEALQNEMNELKASRIGDKSGMLKPPKDVQNMHDDKSKVDNKQTSAGMSELVPSKSLSPERKPGFKLDMGNSSEIVDPKQSGRRNSGFKLDIGSGSNSPEVKPGFKIDFKKSESPTKDPNRRNSGFKLEFNKSESPTKEPSMKSPEKKSGFKLNFNKSPSPTKEPGERKIGFKLNIGSSPSPTKDLQHVEDNSKIDLRGTLKKSETKQSETSNIDLKQSDGKQKFELPQLKSSKEKLKHEQEKMSEKETHAEHKDEHKSDDRKDKQKELTKTEDLRADQGKVERKQNFELPTLKSSKDRSDEKKSKTNEMVDSNGNKLEDTHKKKDDLATTPKDQVKQIPSDIDKLGHLEDSKMKKDTFAEDKQKDDTGKKLELNNTDNKSVKISNKSDANLDDTKNSIDKEPNHSDRFLNKEVNTVGDKLGQVEKNSEGKKLDKKKDEEKVIVKDKLQTDRMEEFIELVKEPDKLEDSDKRDETVLPVTVAEKDDPYIDRPTPSDLPNDTGVHPEVQTDDSNKLTPKTDVKEKLGAQKKVDTKGKFELPNLKSGKHSIDEKSSSKFDKIKQKSEQSESKVSTSDIKINKIGESEKAKKVQETSKNVDQKKKVESPFLKSNKAPENEEKKPFLDSKHSKTFEVPKLKSAKADEKDIKQPKSDSRITKTEEPKRKFELPNLKSSKEGKDKPTEKKLDNKQEEPKRKFDIPNLKSSKQDEKGKLSDKIDLKSDDKKRGFEVPKLKSARGDDIQKKEEKANVSLKKNEQDAKKKFELPNLKSSKGDGKAKVNEKFEVKSLHEDQKHKLDRSNLKSTKEDKTAEPKKTENDSKKGKTPDLGKPASKTFDRPQLKSTKDLKSPEPKTEDVVKKSASVTDTKEKAKAETLKDPVDTFHIQYKGAGEREKLGSDSADKTIKSTTPSRSAIGTEHFETISADTGAKYTDEDYACANDSASDRNYLHVDTQVFTSSRNKTAGVTSTDDSNLATPGVSDLLITKQDGKTNDSVKQADELSHKLQNGDLSPKPSSVLKSGEIANDKSIKSESKDSEKICEDQMNEIARLRKELLLMTERCSSLESDNLSLRDGLNQKDVDQIQSKKQKNDDDTVIKDLKRKLQATENTCEQLESDNKNLKNTLKAQMEENKVKEEIIQKGKDDKAETTEERMMRENQENIMEDMLEENEQLKQDIAELKLEMEEMYDTFRDQEAEEFRELQKELEITAKNCRILQFKLRKLERHNDQVEQDRNQYEDRLRRLQDQFQDRDAVSHIHSLEDELRMAKDVSVRLHDELDLLEEKRGKMEEENRHLTELLEQADRKQFRLELEVDKLRDKLLQLRSELNAAKNGDSGEPRKLNCAEFLAIHREVL